MNNTLWITDRVRCTRINETGRIIGYRQIGHAIQWRVLLDSGDCVTERDADIEKIADDDTADPAGFDRAAWEAALARVR